MPDDVEHKQIIRKRVVLVGQPNVGKSVLFHALTGRYVTVSNYSGTTVEVARGIGTIGGEQMEIVDSPGMLSLVAHSDEERVTRTLLLARPDCLVQVASAMHLPRALALTSALAELNLPMVLCLNMKDETLSRGYRVDVSRLSRVLGIPVVETVATTQEGLDQLKGAILRAAQATWKNRYTPEVVQGIREVESLLPPGTRYLAPLLLQNEWSPGDSAVSGIFLSSPMLERVAAIRRSFLQPLPILLMASRQEQAGQLVAEILSRPCPVGSSRLAAWMDRVGRWCLRPWPGYAIAAFVLWGLYAFVGVLGAQVAVDFLEKVVFGRYVNPLIAALVRAVIPGRFLQDLLVGDYGVFTMALTYAFALILPIVSAFFLALGFLEDTGYLPRLSVLLDRLFRLIGLNGKAVFPMILGLGCGTMALLTTRILDTKRERVLASFLLTLAVPCSAQLGVVLAMTAGLSVAVLGVWLCVTLGSLLGVGWITSRLLPGAPSPFLLEIPPLRWPHVGNLMRKVAARLTWYLREVVPLFVWATIGLYLCDTLGWLTVIKRWCAPVVTGWLGLPEKATEAFLVGFLRRDYGAAGLYQMQRASLLSLRQVTVSIVAITLFMPCIAQSLMSLRERGFKVTLAMSVAVSAYALTVAGLLNRLLLTLGWA